MSSPHKSSESLTDEQSGQFDRIAETIENFLDEGAVSEAFLLLHETFEVLGEDPEQQALRAALLILRAELFIDQDDSDAALADATQALSLGMNDEGKAAAHSVAGWAYFNLEEYENASERFAAALKLMPDEVMFLHGHALALQELGEFEKARAELTHAIHVDDEDADLYALRSEIHLQLEDMEAAERDIRRACELDSEEPDYALSFARLMLVGGDIAGGLKIMDELIGEGHDASLETILFRSHLRLLAGQPKEANADAMSASNRFPDEAFAFVQLANVQLAQGNTSMALRAAERAIGLDPSLPDGYLVRGTALYKSGKSAEARKDLERASAAPAELPMFLLGSAYDVIGGEGFDNSLLEMLGQTSKSAGAAGFEDAFAALGGLPGMGNMDPMAMLGQMFDDSGNIRGPLKGLFEMALKNAPQIMKNMPESMKANLGGVDPEKLDMSNLSADDIEEQMRDFYQKMKTSKGPKKPGTDEE